LTKVINFTAGPSAGKTTNGLLLAGFMKRARMNVIYLPEVALEMILQGRAAELDDQFYVFGEQHHRLYSAVGQFDFVVTDSPLFHSMHYVWDGMKKYESGIYKNMMLNNFISVIESTYWMYDNVTFFVDRKDREFVQAVRIHNEEESKSIDGDIRIMLDDHMIDYTVVSSAEEAYRILFNADVPDVP